MYFRALVVDVLSAITRVAGLSWNTRANQFWLFPPPRGGGGRGLPSNSVSVVLPVSMFSWSKTLVSAVSKPVLGDEFPVLAIWVDKTNLYPGSEIPCLLVYSLVY